jgi:hypothetical protein
MTAAGVSTIFHDEPLLSELTTEYENFRSTGSSLDYRAWIKARLAPVLSQANEESLSRSERARCTSSGANSTKKGHEFSYFHCVPPETSAPFPATSPVPVDRHGKPLAPLLSAKAPWNSNYKPICGDLRGNEMLYAQSVPAIDRRIANIQASARDALQSGTYANTKYCE